LKPHETGKRYDAIASWWNSYQDTMDSGVRYLERAIGFCENKRAALDVGCGTGGRLIDVMANAGFTVTGIDVSQGMLAHARQRHPHVTFVHADISEWQPPTRYDLIVAWESTFHLPHAMQQPVLEKLCAALNDGGVLLFTGANVDGEITGEMEGATFYYSSLGMAHYLRILQDSGCDCLVIERDQYPELHLVVIAIKASR
jgi:trans-aconitate methyltransferase